MSENNPELDQLDEGLSPKENETASARLLEESKRNKERFQEANAKLKAASAQLKELEAFKTLKLEEEGNYKTLLEKANEKLKAKEEEAKSLRQKTLRSNIVSTLSRLAPDAYDVDLLLTQNQHKNLLDAGLDEETLTLADADALNFLNAVFAEKPFLKKQNSNPSVHSNGKPVYVEKDIKEKSYKEMSERERAEYKIKLALGTN